MMQVIPTWQVTFLKLGAEQQMLRVPETNLEAIIHVLVLNGMDEIHAETERSPWSLALGLGNESDVEES